MKPYVAIVHKEPGSAYGLTFPDAPGCFSAADDLDDVFTNAAEALELWAEGRLEDRLPIPPTRDLLDIKADPNWSSAFDDAVLVIAVPRPVALLNKAA